jgi:N-methylhydantoinase B
LGDPLERDSESVAKDIRWNLVTHEAAEKEYGVVLKSSVRRSPRHRGCSTSGSRKSSACPEL